MGAGGATPVWPWVLEPRRATARDQFAEAPGTCPSGLDYTHLPAPHLTAPLPVRNGKERHSGHEVDGYFLPCSWGRRKHISKFFRVPCDPSRRRKQTTHTTARRGSDVQLGGEWSAQPEPAQTPPIAAGSSSQACQPQHLELMDIYYFCLGGRWGEIHSTINDPSWSVSSTIFFYIKR